MRRTVFGRDPALYDRARLPYPQKVYEILTERCGLRPGVSVFEIGPGTGIATRELLRRGVGELVLIEADRRLARFLKGSLPVSRAGVQIVNLPFERARLPRGRFDLGVAATSFHWLPARSSLRRVARALRPGGWWAAWYSHTGDLYHTSPFQKALQPLYRELRGGRPSRPPTRASEARLRARRLAELRSVGFFDRISREELRREVTLPTARVQALWSTFSEIATLPPRARRWFLEELGDLADHEFGGMVSLPTLTTVYTARRI